MRKNTDIYGEQYCNKEYASKYLSVPETEIDDLLQKGILYMNVLPLNESGSACEEDCIHIRMLDLNDVEIVRKVMTGEIQKDFFDESQAEKLLHDACQKDEEHSSLSNILFSECEDKSDSIHYEKENIYFKKKLVHDVVGKIQNGLIWANTMADQGQEQEAKAS